MKAVAGPSNERAGLVGRRCSAWPVPSTCTGAQHGLHKRRLHSDVLSRDAAHQQLQWRQQTLCRSAASGEGAAIPPEGSSSSPLQEDAKAAARVAGRWAPWVLAPTAALLAAIYFVPAARVAAVGALRTCRSALATWPGFSEGLSLIFLSELGDKTFFIAALLAMRLGRLIALTGSVLALALMTVISVGFGRLCAQVPAFVDTTMPVQQYVGAALLCYFGFRSIMSGLRDGGDEELAEARAATDAVESGKIYTGRSKLRALWEVGSLVFVAEWGDRSMLATIALAVTNSPWSIIAGATLGHALATVLAVLAGAVASRYISERMVNFIAGGLFLLFAAETLLGLGML